MPKMIRPLRRAETLTFQLNETTLDEIVLAVQKFAREEKLDDASVTRYGFLVDDALYRYLQLGGRDATLTVIFSHRLFTPCLTIALQGEKIDPYAKKTDAFGSYENSYIISSGQLPEYQYANGVNILRLTLKREQSMIRQILIVSFAAALLGVVGLQTFPDTLRESILSAVVGPIIDMFFNLLRCIAGPMVFLSVVWGICGMGDSHLFGRIGKRVILYCAFITLSGAIVGAFFFPFLSQGFSSGGTGGGQLSALLEMILSIVPSSIVDPFSTGNTLQIIFLATAMGIALITMSNKVGHLIVAIDQVNLIVQHLMSIVSLQVPYIVFLLIVNMIWTGSLRLFSTMGRFFLIMLIAFVTVSLLAVLCTALRQKTKFFTIFRKNLSSLIVAFTTASSAAAFASNMKNATERYGINSDLAGFSIPLGMIVHNPIAACYNVVIIVYFASTYELSCSVGWLMIGIIVSTIVALSSPPIPGGAAICYTLMFTQMGIPDEALAVALIVDVITDFFVTGFECFVLPISLTNIAAKLDMLDREILQKK